MRNPMLARELDLGAMVVGATIGTIGVVSVFTLPLLTMRLWAEEKRSGTVELLLTFPLRDSEIVLGKFLAALAVYGVLLLLTGCYPLLASAVGRSTPAPSCLVTWGRSCLGQRCWRWAFCVPPGRKIRSWRALCLAIPFFLADRPRGRFCRRQTRHPLQACLPGQSPR